MDSNKKFEFVKEVLIKVEESGQRVVEVRALKSMLDDLDKETNYLGNEIKQLEAEYLVRLEAKYKSNIEMFKSVIDAGRETLNAVQLINGGAVVALLGFLANILAKSEMKHLAVSLAVPILLFGMGVFCGALGFGVRYGTQYFYATKRKKTGHTLNIVSCVLAFMGFSFFVVGLCRAYSVFVTL